MTTDTEADKLTVRDLRRRWKPHKLRLLEMGDEQPTSIRFHRACSWIDRVGEEGAEDHDTDLISLWIAFNSLYGQWDGQKREPRPDRESWRGFVDRILRLDEPGFIADSLSAHRNLIMTLLEDEYLSGYYWEEPGEKRAGQSKKAMYDARTWYLEKRWIMILERLLERVYLMRCQLVHGAATHGGKLNRTSLRHCVMMMQRLLPAILLVWIDHGADENWGEMCYPPLVSTSRDEQQARHRPGRPR